jgi:hypothetical protein
VATLAKKHRTIEALEQRLFAEARMLVEAEARAA